MPLIIDAVENTVAASDGPRMERRMRQALPRSI
jgi:hypothetical protein